MAEVLTKIFFEAVITIVALTALNFAVLALTFKLYTEMFKQIAQEKRKG